MRNKALVGDGGALSQGLQVYLQLASERGLELLLFGGVFDLVLEFKVAIFQETLSGLRNIVFALDVFEG